MFRATFLHPANGMAKLRGSRRNLWRDDCWSNSCRFPICVPIWCPSRRERLEMEGRFLTFRNRNKWTWFVSIFGISNGGTLFKFCPFSLQDGGDCDGQFPVSGELWNSRNQSTKEHCSQSLISTKESASPAQRTVKQEGLYCYSKQV